MHGEATTARRAADTKNLPGVGGFFLLHEGLEVSDGLLHGTRALDYLRQEHLARAEQVADHVHAVHQRAFDDLDRTAAARRDRGAALLGVLDDELRDAVDQRVREHLVDHEVSVGDVVLAGGEVAACLIIEAVTRLLPGVMGNSQSPVTESFGAEGLLEEPQYTRPAEFRGWEVPDVLRSGDHAKVEAWRHAQALWRTLQMRPDLIEARGGLTDSERALLEGVAFASYPSMFTSERP